MVCGRNIYANRFIIKYRIYNCKLRDNIPSNTITRTKLIDIYKLCKNKQIEYENTNKEISDFISYYYKSVINSGKKNEI